MKRTAHTILDEYLVLAAQQGDEMAMSRLVGRFDEPFRRYAARLMGNPEEAADAVQEAWMKIVKGIRSLDDPARFRSWAYRIVNRRCCDRLRAGVRRFESSTLAIEPEDTHAGRGPGDPIEEAEQLAELRAALQNLPQDRRELLAMYYMDDLTVREIAEVLDVKPGTVKSRLHYAREELRRYLEPAERTAQSVQS
ncbi:RNA polymerase sigma factor [Stratiformator vulcanicus]|uniref:ECF RNA polymerase sigma factor SigW n=1 Tax=Stratiformator vulcanicus TaxID=2527980 RepID=A0A517R2K4_9PLAN|nr:RNA polymerase sigma factor [Stratiformator vulcanicus]QDT38107.1 ECF RNA polymerase sigma factor SigW [Stratiformator vulcanicus]